MQVDNGTEEISYHHIVQALKSVLDQTNQEFEILVVDDGSTDDSLQWAKSVQSPKIRILNRRTRGSLLQEMLELKMQEELISYFLTRMMSGIRIICR